jgi:hypothetical protein
MSSGITLVAGGLRGTNRHARNLQLEASAMAVMTERKFYSAIKAHFGPVLEEQGFSCAPSKRANYVKWVSEDICHVFFFYRTRGLGMYHAWCFATSPKLEPEFDRNFPDNMGATMRLHVLDKQDIVGTYQCPFYCANDDAFQRSFKRDILPVLPRAIAHLDGIKTIADLEPHLASELMRGLAHYHLGDLKNARISLRQHLTNAAGDTYWEASPSATYAKTIYEKLIEMDA